MAVFQEIPRCQNQCSNSSYSRNTQLPKYLQENCQGQRLLLSCMYHYILSYHDTCCPTAQTFSLFCLPEYQKHRDVQETAPAVEYTNQCSADLQSNIDRIADALHNIPPSSKVCWQANVTDVFLSAAWNTVPAVLWVYLLYQQIDCYCMRIRIAVEQNPHSTELVSTYEKQFCRAYYNTLLRYGAIADWVFPMIGCR